MPQFQPHRRRAHRIRAAIVIIATVGLLLLWALVPAGIARPKLSTTPQILPELQTYPLPTGLSAIVPGDDYFDQVDQKNPAGSLIWSQFPITIALDRANSQEPREAVWLQSVRSAISDWQVYLPLIETTDLEQANIVVRRAGVPLRRDKTTGQIQRARFAETRYRFFVDGDQRLRHRMQINLSPNQADASLLAGIRHELGHALGIWGHSDRPADIMYFSQVSQVAAISDRDQRTLQRIYQQPTRLGGQMQ
jgi:predicted Zn-dependent protease